jgi:hypothetical protein
MKNKKYNGDEETLMEELFEVFDKDSEILKNNLAIIEKFFYSKAMYSD